jgi:lipopolysaccharide transport system ATP-binding protein
MSSDLAVQARGLSKVYPVYAQPHHRLMQALDPRSGRRWHNEFHALRPMDLSIRRGETVGIVGRNGSGKSTLLQLICGTLAPTTGTVEVSGRVAALLELGAGFNPDFTGRENAYLNGSVLGLSRNEMDACFDDIAAFADIGEFMEQPVKSYSSGMYVRLAFAVAINVTPDILIVDEALSVGDEAFQRKCFARIERIRERGATVLFVSHAAGTVVELCDRAVLLDHGEMLAQGTPRGVIARYQKLVYAPAESAERVREEIRSEYGTGEVDPGAAQAQPAAGARRAGTPAARAPSDLEQARWDPGMVPTSTVVYENRGARIVDPHIQTPRGERVNVLVPGDEYVYSYGVEFEQTLTRVRWGMMMRSITGLDIAGCASAQPKDAIPVVERGTSLTARFRFRCLLAPGVYFANAGVLAAMQEGEEFVDRRIDVAMFRVMPQWGRLATGLVDMGVAPEAE